MKSNSIVQKNQQPLTGLYEKEPNAARITDMAIVEGKNLDDRFHTSVYINEELKISFPVGVHSAIEEFHNFPNPGDILCASLASCFESTLRI